MASSYAGRGWPPLAATATPTAAAPRGFSPVSGALVPDLLAAWCEVVAVFVYGELLWPEAGSGGRGGGGGGDGGCKE